MLVISRKEGEEFTIGNDIKVAVLSVDGQRVRIGIKAPDDVLILRAELVQADGDGQLMGGLGGGHV